MVQRHRGQYSRGEPENMIAHEKIDMRHIKPYLTAAVLSIAAHGVAAQSVENLDLTEVGKSQRWKVVGRSASVVDIKGKRALKLSEAAGMGVVWIDGYEFSNLRVTRAAKR